MRKIWKHEGCACKLLHPSEAESPAAEEHVTVKATVSRNHAVFGYASSHSEEPQLNDYV